MDEEKKYNKIKMFLFLVFAVFATFLITSVIGITRDLFQGISSKGDEFKCNELSYEINDRSLSYEGNTLIFELINQDYEINISKITLITVSSERVLVPAIASRGGNSVFVKFEDVNITDEFSLRINDCKNIKKFDIKK